MGSSLFYYLQHPVSRWDPRAPLIGASMAVALNWDNQDDRPALLARTDLRVEILATCQTGEKQAWELVRVSRVQ